MNKYELFEVFENIDEKYILEAKKTGKRTSPFFMYRPKNERMIEVKVMKNKRVSAFKTAVVLMLIAFAGASAVFAGMKKNQSDEKPVTENYFTEIKYELPYKVNSAYDIFCMNGNVYITGTLTENSEIETGVCITDMNGNVLTGATCENMQIRKVFHSRLGDIFIYQTNYFSDGGYKNIVSHISADGEYLGTVEIELGTYDYFNDFLVTDDGRYVFSDDEKIYIADDKGKLLAEIKPASDSSDLNLFSNSDGVYVLLNNIGKAEIKKLDAENKNFEKISEPQIDLNDDVRIFDGNGRYDFFALASGGVYGYEMKENKFSEIVNFANSDIETIPYGNLFWMSDENNFSYSLNNEIHMMKRADEETLEIVRNRKTVTVACDSEILREQIIRFNKENPDCRIKVKDCLKYGNDRFSWLNEDIIKGEIPDMIVCDDSFDLIRYAKSGMFADINEMMANDGETERSDFFENILDSYEIDGKLYFMPVFFELYTLSGKESVLGERNSITYDEFFEMDKSCPMLENEDREWLTDVFIRKDLSEFVDFSEMKCDFENENFIRLLEFIKERGADPAKYAEICGSDDFRRRVAEDRCVCFLSNLSSFMFSSYGSQINYGKEKKVSYIGLPSGDKTGASAGSSCIFAINERSENKDIAWRFAKSILSEENQLKNEFPIRISSFCNYMSKSGNNSVNGHNSVSLMLDLYGKKINMRSVNTNDILKIKELAETVNRASLSDTRINSIINEQTELFFSGSQTAEETAEQIQKKIDIYFREIR